MDVPPSSRTRTMNVDHETWSTKMDYVMSVLGYIFGIGAMWKFPYLCMRNGGGAFLIPVIIFTIIGAIPCAFLEMTIGQFTQSGPIKVWNLYPPFKGVGIGTVMISLFFSTYYPALLAWCLYYFYYSFSTILPWADCNNDWNTPTCVSQSDALITITTNSSTGEKIIMNNTTSFVGSIVITSAANVTRQEPGRTAAEEFWRFEVLDLSSGLDDIGNLRGPLAGCLTIIYIIIFLFMFKGIKVSGKVVYVTVIVPYILITAIFIRGCFLPGSADGIYHYIYPDIEKLLDAKIWVEACSYVLYSIGIAFGCVVTMAGHNKFNNNCLMDAVLFSIADLVASICGGFACFSILGHIAYLRGITVAAFESSGFNLGFIVYPQAMALLPLPQLWSVLTFSLVLTLGIDSLIPPLEMAATALREQFPILRHRRWLNNLIVLLPIFLIGLIYMTQGGMYVLTLVEWYAFFPSMVLFAMLECFIVSWIYGTRRLEADIAMMWGKKPPQIMNICFRYICPGLFLILFSYSLYSYRPPAYGDFVYPTWASGIGWTIYFASVMPIPVVFVWTVYKTEADTLKQKILKALKPSNTWTPEQEGERLSGSDIEMTEDA